MIKIKVSQKGYKTKPTATAIDRIEELEDDLRMYEDNYCGTFSSLVKS